MAEPFPSLVSYFDLVPSQTALVVIDMQNFAASTRYGWGPVLSRYYPHLATYFFRRLQEEVIPNIQALLACFRERGLRVIYTTVGPHSPDGADYLHMRSSAASERIPALSPVGTPEHAIIAPLTPQAGDIVINKVSQGAFTSTGIDLILRNLGIDTLVVTGVHTNGCVETTARQAVDLGYKTLLVADATAAFDQESDYATLRTFRRSLGRVADAQQVIEALSAHDPHKHDVPFEK